MFRTNYNHLILALLLQAEQDPAVRERTVQKHW